MNTLYPAGMDAENLVDWFIGEASPRQRVNIFTELLTLHSAEWQIIGVDDFPHEAAWVNVLLRLNEPYHQIRKRQNNQHECFVVMQLWYNPMLPTRWWEGHVYTSEQTRPFELADNIVAWRPIDVPGRDVLQKVERMLIGRGHVLCTKNFTNGDA